MDETPEEIRQFPAETPPETLSKWRSALTVVLVLLLFLFYLYEPVLRAYGEWLVHRDEPRQADLIVVLGGSPVIRTLAAVDYYHRELAPAIYVSRGNLAGADLVEDLDLTNTGEWGLARALLVAKGVPEEKIHLDAVFVPSTMAEAERFKVYLESNPVKSIILVTSEFHSGRAYALWRSILPEEVAIISLPSRYDPFDPEDWWKSRETAKAGFLEFLKIIFNLVESKAKRE
jgi:uncharacterized SAM-binding protein YcdF (DUF218 family)